MVFLQLGEGEEEKRIYSFPQYPANYTARKLVPLHTQDPALFCLLERVQGIGLHHVEVVGSSEVPGCNGIALILLPGSWGLKIHLTGRGSALRPCGAVCAHSTAYFGHNDPSLLKDLRCH